MLVSEKEKRILYAAKVADMRIILNKAEAEHRDLTASECSVFDKMDVEVEQLRQEIGNAEEVRGSSRDEHCSNLERELSQVINPHKGSNFRGSEYEESRVHEPWVNQQTGQPVKVLTPEQRMSDLVHDPEREQLSLGKMIRGLATGEWKGAASEHRAMNEGTLGSGGYLVPSPLAAGIIDKARNASVMFRAGSLLVPMDSQTLAMARIAGDATAGWHTEAAAITASDMTFEKVTFTAQTLAALCQVSIEVLEDTNIDQIVSDALGKVLALELDRACIRGSGTAPELKGIRNQTGVNVDTTTFTTNGSVISASAPTGAVAHIWLAKMIAAMWAVNENPNAVIWAPRTAGEMDQLVDSTGQPLRELPSESNLLKLQTASIPINLTQGTSSDCSEAYLGNFSQALIGMRTNLVLEISRVATVGSTSMFSTLQAAIRAYLRADFQVARPAAFRVVCGIR